MNRTLVLSLIATVVFLGMLFVLTFILSAYISDKNNSRVDNITNFEECEDAGYPIMESYPRQCRAGISTFVEDISKNHPDEVATSTATSSATTTSNGAGATTTIPRTSGGCYIGGCSGQICSNMPDVISNCEFRPEYMCYGSAGATCGRQADGECGWSDTPALRACLSNPSKK